MGGWMTQLRNKDTWALFLTVYPVTCVEWIVGVGAVFLPRGLILPFILRLKSKLKGISHHFGSRIKSTPSCFHSTNIYEVLTMCQALLALT